MADFGQDLLKIAGLKNLGKRFQFLLPVFVALCNWLIMTLASMDGRTGKKRQAYTIKQACAA